VTEGLPDNPEVSLRRVRLNRGGYDAYGSYWGAGQPLYWYNFIGADGQEVDDHIRADDRDHAKEVIRRKHGDMVRFLR
jgi:hypothetical protein